MSLQNQMELAGCHQELGLGIFLLLLFRSVCFFTATPTAVHSPPPSHQLCLSAGSAHALQLTHPLRTPTFHPNLLPTLGHSSAGMQLHSQGVKAFLGIRGPCSSSPAEPGRPTFPLSFCTLQFDIPCTPSSAVTACPARQTSIAHMG